MSITQLAQQSYQVSVKGAVNIGVLADMQASPVNLFRVRNGPVLVTQLWGFVNTGITWRPISLSPLSWHIMGSHIYTNT